MIVRLVMLDEDGNEHDGSVELAGVPRRGDKLEVITPDLGVEYVRVSEVAWPLNGSMPTVWLEPDGVVPEETWRDVIAAVRGAGQ